MSKGVKKILLDLTGLLFCLVPPIIVTFGYFPLWKHSVGLWASLGGGVAVAFIIVAVVLSKYIKAKLNTPSPVIIFLLCYGFFALMQKVSEGLTVISFWGFVGSAVGAVFFWWSKRYEERRIE